MAMANYGKVTNKVYADMTNYDIYMMRKQKKQAESRLFDRKQKQPEISYEDYRKRVEMPIKTESKGERQSQGQPQNEYSYKDYLLDQLQRNTPEELMSEEEFYESKLSAKSFSDSSQVFSHDIEYEKRQKRYQKYAKQTKAANKNTQIKKGGKIFIAFYVLIVMAIASILIVMNTDTPFNSQSVDAVGGNESEQSASVQAMNVDESRESEDENWFDELCKSLK